MSQGMPPESREPDAETVPEPDALSPDDDPEVPNLTSVPLAATTPEPVPKEYPVSDTVPELDELDELEPEFPLASPELPLAEPVPLLEVRDDTPVPPPPRPVLVCTGTVMLSEHAERAAAARRTRPMESRQRTPNIAGCYHRAADTHLAHVDWVRSLPLLRRSRPPSVTHRVTMRPRFLAMLTCYTLTSCGPVPTTGADGTGSGASAAAANTCGSVAACGGNLVGTWTAAAMCTTAPYVTSDGACTKAETESTTNISLSAVFNTDGSYSMTFGAYSDQLGLTASAPCLTELGANSCDDYTGALTTAGYSNVSCADASGGGCTCQLAAANDPSDDSGTYSTQGNSIVLSGTTNGLNSGTYCVSGSTLHLLLQVAAGSAATEDLVLVMP
jgi:hypothetical protein